MRDPERLAELMGNMGMTEQAAGIAKEPQDEVEEPSQKPQKGKKRKGKGKRKH